MGKTVNEDDLVICKLMFDCKKVKKESSVHREC